MAWSTGPLTASMMRFLTLIIKVIQNLANGILAGRKEEMLIPMAPVIERNLPRIRQFFDDISVGSSSLALPDPLSVCGVEKVHPHHCLKMPYFQSLDSEELEQASSQRQGQFAFSLDALTSSQSPSDEGYEESVNPLAGVLCVCVSFAHGSGAFHRFSLICRELGVCRWILVLETSIPS